MKMPALFSIRLPIRSFVVGTAAALCLTLASADVAHAAPKDGAGDAKGHKDHKKLSPEEREKKHAEIQRKIKVYILAELSSRLNLDDRKTNLLSDVINKQTQERDANHKAMREEMKNLRGLLDKNADDAQLRASIQKLASLRDKSDHIASFVQDTSSFLSTKEQAQLVVALPEVMRDLKKMKRGHRGPPDGEFDGRGD